MNGMLKRLFLISMLSLLIFSTSMRVRDENLSPVNHSLTIEECSACHLAFPAAMLPAESWGRLMRQLDSHFGEDASIDDKSMIAILEYLQSNSADSSWIGNRFSRGQSGAWSTRITESDHWLREHSNLNFMKESNSEFINKTDCTACHEGAAKGDFDVHDA